MTEPIIAAVVEAAPVEIAPIVADPVTPAVATPPVEFAAIVLDSQEATDNFVKDRVARATRAAQTAAKAERKAIEDELNELKNAALSETEKKDNALKAAEQLAAERGDELTKLQRASLVSDLAQEAGLPKKFWDRVRGDTDEEIVADIAELMEGIPAPADPVKGTPPSPAPKAKVKVQPTGNEPDPGLNADAIVKELSRGGF